LGAVVLPINWRLSAEEALFNLNDGAPELLFADSEYQDMIEDIKSKLSSVKEFFNLKPPEGNFSDFETLLDNDGQFEPVEVSTGDGAVIIHTAAVAGRPRGALLSQGNIISANIHINLLMNLSADDVHLNILPLFHVGGLFMATAGFHAGALNLNMSKFDAGQAMRIIQTFRFEPLRLAIEDLQESFGSEYPNGDGFLRQLQQLDQKISTGNPVSKKAGSQT